MNMTKAIYWVLCSKYFTLACMYHSFLMIQKLSAIANTTLYKVTMKSYTCLISFSFLTMWKTLFHLYLLTSIQDFCINLFWEAWLWENTQIQVLNPKPIAPCWESFSDHFWQYQRLLASSVGVCHNHQHLGSDKRLQGWLTQRSATVSEVIQVSRTRKTVGLGPTARMFAIWQVILDLLSLSIFICAVKLITPTLNSCYIFDKFHLSGSSRDDVRSRGTAAAMLSIDCLCNTLLHTAAGNSWCFGKWPVTDGTSWYREKQRSNK